jgi:Flp pilus assembly protein TadB
VSTDADVRTIVVTPIGVGCLGAGLVLNATGWLWMRRIVGVRR